jgi:FkbM family methyltransferase
MIENFRVNKTARLLHPYVKHLIDFFSSKNIENKQLRLFIRSVQPDCIIDIGANLGQFIIEANLAKFQGKYIAIEPLARFHKGYQKLQNFTDFQSLMIAVSNQVSVETFNVSNDSGMSSSLLTMHNNFELLNDKIKSVHIQEVTTVPLADIVDKYCKENLKVLIKIDVQGAESKVIESLSVQHKNIVALIIETSYIDLYDHGARMSEVVASLLERGFQVVSVKEKGYISSIKRFSYCDLYVERI